MSSTYTAMPTDTYALVHDAVAAQYAGREWPEPLVELHLRWLVGEFRAGRLGPGRRERWPTVDKLAKLVGWFTPSGKPGKDRMSAFMAREADHEIRVEGETRIVRALHWVDPYQPVTLEELRGDRLWGHNDRARPTVRRRCADGAPTVRTEQRRESERETDGAPTADRRQTDAVRDTSARVPSTRYPEDRGVAREAPPPGPTGDPLAPVVLPDGREVPGDVSGLLPQLGERDRLRLARAPGIGGSRDVLAIPAGRLRYAGGIGEALARTVEAELRRQRIEPGCLAEPETANRERGPPGKRRAPPAATASRLSELFASKAAK